MNRELFRNVDKEENYTFDLNKSENRHQLIKVRTGQDQIRLNS